MSDLELVMTEQGQAFAPDASSKRILTEYKNPFGFSLQVVKSGEDITLTAQGTDVAQVRCCCVRFTRCSPLMSLPR